MIVHLSLLRSGNDASSLLAETDPQWAQGIEGFCQIQEVCASVLIPVKISFEFFDWSSGL